MFDGFEIESTNCKSSKSLRVDIACCAKHEFPTNVFENRVQQPNIRLAVLNTSNALDNIGRVETKLASTLKGLCMFYNRATIRSAL